MSDLSLPTIQRMEASDGVIRGNVDSLMKLVGALDAAGIELIGENAASAGGGRGVRLEGHARHDARRCALLCVAVLLAHRRRWRSRSRRRAGGDADRLWREPALSALLALVVAAGAPARRGRAGHA